MSIYLLDEAGINDISGDRLFVSLFILLDIDLFSFRTFATTPDQVNKSNGYLYCKSPEQNFLHSNKRSENLSYKTPNSYRLNYNETFRKSSVLKCICI